MKQNILEDVLEAELQAELGAKKFDNGKTMWSAMPWRGLQLVADVMTFGAQKYGEHNFLEKPYISNNRYFSACMRHLIAAYGGNHLDEESGKPHLAHAVCCLLMWLETELKRQGEHK